MKSILNPGQVKLDELTGLIEVEGDGLVANDVETGFEEGLGDVKVEVVLDDDGDEDLLVPSGKGGRLGFYRNEGGRFTDLSQRFPVTALDQTVALPVPGPSGTTILIGESNYEAASPEAALAASAGLSVSVEGGPWSEAVGGDRSSAGALATADIDGDGDLDLFVGGRFVPAAYPVAARSRLFLNEEGGYVSDVSNRAVLESIGLVSAATFSDIDGDRDNVQH